MWQRILTLIFTSVETVLVGGTFYGWSNLQNVFVQEGFFSTQNSTLQVERLNLVSTLSTTTGALISVLFGFLIDAKGFWFSRSVILAVVAFSYVLFSLSNVINNYIVFAGGIVLLAGNLGVWTANCRISGLFPGYELVYGYLINGCGQSSYGTFYLFNRLYFRFGVSFETIFYLAALFTLLSHAHTFLLFPSKSVREA